MFLTVKPPLSAARASEPSSTAVHRGEGEAHVLGGQRRAELRGELRGHPVEAAGVDEVDGGVRAAGGVVDPLELVEVGVVDEALRDEDHRLASPGAGEAVERPLEDLEGDAVAGAGLESTPRRRGRSRRGRRAVPVRGLSRSRWCHHRHAVLLEAPHDLARRPGGRGRRGCASPPSRSCARGSVSGILRPSSRLRVSMSLSRPASIRAVHQAAPEVAIEGDVVALADPVLEEARHRGLGVPGPVGASGSCRRRRSRRCDPRPPRPPVLVETRGGGGGSSAGSSGSSTASKLTIVWGDAVLGDDQVVLPRPRGPGCPSCR